ncbi:MAG: hypothetical protein PHQ40_03795 [Anaerolineaceae bacterium]|nr:hypothetical protein [Anaerolineaceae bacterium]
MDNPLLTALTISGASILVLLLVLAAFAGLVYLMTALIKDKPEEEVAEVVQAPEATPILGDSVRKRVAIIALGLASTENDTLPTGQPAEKVQVDTWLQFHRNRTLGKSVYVRR